MRLMLLLLLASCAWAQEDVPYLAPTIRATYMSHTGSTLLANVAYVGGRTNLLSFAEYPTANASGGAVWGATNTTRSIVTADLPAGSSVGTKLTETTATGNHNIVQTVTSVSNWTLSGKFKGSTNRGIWWSIAGASVYMDQTDCSMYSSSGTVTGAVVSGPDANGWCSITIKSTSSAATQIKIGSATNSGGKTYASFASSFAGDTNEAAYFADLTLVAGQTAGTFEGSPYGDFTIYNGGWGGYEVDTVSTYAYTPPNNSLMVDLSSNWSTLLIGCFNAADTKYALGLAKPDATSDIVAIAKNGILGVRISVTAGGSTNTSSTITLPSSTTTVDGRVYALLLRNDAGTIKLTDLATETEVTLSASTVSGLPRICAGCDGTSNMGTNGASNWRGIWYWPRSIPIASAKATWKLFIAEHTQYLLATGDSLTVGTGAGYPYSWPNQAVTTGSHVLDSKTWVVNHGIGGQKAADLVNRTASQIAFYDPIIKRKAAAVLIGTNDFGTSTASQIYGFVTTITTALVNAGFTNTVVGTIPLRCDASADETKRTTVNSSIIAGVGTDIPRAAGIGEDATLTNTTPCNAGTTPWYTDKLHFLTAGYTIFADLMAVQLLAGGLQ